MASSSSGERQRFCPEPTAERSRLGRRASAAGWQASATLASTATAAAPKRAEKTRQAVSGTSAGAAAAAKILEAKASGSCATTAASGNDHRIPSSAERVPGATRSSNALYHFCSTREGGAKTSTINDGPRCRYRGCNFGVVDTLLIGAKREKDTQQELQFCSRHAEQARLMFGKSGDDFASKEVDLVESHTTCTAQGCIIAPSFGLEGSNNLTRCLRHASAGMTFVGMTTCRFPGCLRNALDARRPGEADGQFCAHHVLEPNRDDVGSECDRRQDDEATFSVASEGKSLGPRHAKHGTFMRGKSLCGHPACLLEATYDVGGNVFERGKMGFCWRHSMYHGQAPSTSSTSAVSGTLTGPRGIIAENGAGGSRGVTRPRHMTIDLPRLKTDGAAAATRYRQHANRSCGTPSVRIAYDARLAPTAGINKGEENAAGVGGALGLTSADRSPSAQRARCRAQGCTATVDEGGRSEKRARQHRDLPQAFASRGDQPDVLDTSVSSSGSSTDGSERESGKKIGPRRPGGGGPSRPVPGITGCQEAPREAAVCAPTAGPMQSGGRGQGTPVAAMTAACAGARAAAAAGAAAAPGAAQRRNGISSASSAVATTDAVRRGESSTEVVAVQGNGGKLQPRRRVQGRERAPLILTPAGWLEWDWNFALCAGDGDIASPEA